MTGTDFLLDSLLKLAGVDVEQTKAQMKGFAQKFIEQDNLLREIARDQKTIIAQQSQILAGMGLSIEPATTGEESHGENPVNGHDNTGQSDVRAVS